MNGGEMKDSGVAWLGEIPSHWEMIRNGALFLNRSEKGYPDLPLYSVSQRYGVILQEYGDEEIVRSSEDKSNYKRIVASDIVYNKMRMWQGAVGVAQAEGIVSPAYIVCAPRKEISPAYFNYLFRTPLYIAEFGKYSYGIVDDMNSLRFEDFKTIYSIFPPLHEQRAIASYLDRETARIDRLIGQTERLNDLLREKRTALISRAVTKGLDASVAMKASGVEWLGEIPRHWDVKPIKTVISQVMNGAWGAAINDLRDTLLPCIVLRGTDFPDATEGSLINAPLRYIDKRDAERKTLQQGDIVVEISGGSDTQATGRALLITDKLVSNANAPLLCTNFAKALRINNDIVTPKYFSIYWMCLYGLDRLFAYEKRTTGIRNFQYKDFVSNESILLPPLHEQRAIADHLDAETARIDRLIGVNDRLINLLREKRTALISAAITGKISVPSASSVVK